MGVDVCITMVSLSLSLLPIKKPFRPPHALKLAHRCHLEDDVKHKSNIIDRYKRMYMYIDVCDLYSHT